MLKIIRFFLGFVVFTIKGERAEHFLNLSSRTGINLWDIKKTQNLISAKVAANEYKSLRIFAKMSHVCLKLKRKYGFPFFINRYNKRLGLALGAMCFCLIIYSMSLFVWNINISGNINVKTTEILKTMKELGLFQGVFKKNIDVKTLENNAMNKIGNLSWLSVNIKGTTANIELEERELPPQIVPKEKPCNIKAAKDGQITRIEVYAGSAEVRCGDAVSKGDLLINGFVEDIFGINKMHHARAKVFARTKYTFEEKVALEQVIEIPTGKMLIRKNLNICGINLPFTLTPKPKGNYQRELETTQTKLGDFLLPIKWYKEIWRQSEQKNIVLTLQEAKEKADQAFFQLEQREFKDKKILDRESTQKLENETFYKIINYTCEENIAIQEEIVLE